MKFTVALFDAAANLIRTIEVTAASIEEALYTATGTDLFTIWRATVTHIGGMPYTPVTHI